MSRLPSVVALLGAAAAVPAQGNTLLIVADDVGVDAIAAYREGAAPPPTPTIDALARNGVLFRNAYANPICSPTRATLHTGRYCSRTGVGAVVSFGNGVPLALGEHTLPEILGRGGYQTGLFGKWHLGDARNGGDRGPNLAGWSRFAGHMWNIRAPESYVSWRKVTDGVPATSTVYATTANVDDALAWIRAQQSSQRRWFCCICFNAAHAPFHVPPQNLHTYNISGSSPTPLKFKAMVQAMDTELGRLFTSLGAAVMGRTDVIFIGDNGTPAGATEAPFPSSHAKASLYEGGINVPLIVSGPSVVAPGREEPGLVASVDLFPTVLELSGVDPRAAVPRAIPLDGVSLVPYLRRTNPGSLRDTVFAERFGSQPNVAGRDGVAIRDARYKLIRWSTPVREAFFDLQSDRFEQSDLLVRGLTAAERARYDALAAELDRLQADAFPYGQGCRGNAASEPRLELWRGEPPRVGAPFVSVVAGASANAPAAVGCLGLGPRSLDLRGIGMPGCTLLVDLDLVVPFPLAGGFGAWSLQVPNTGSLLGVVAYEQAVVVEPGANPQNLTMTEGVRLRIGGR